MAKMINLNFYTLIIHGQNDRVKLHYPSQGIPKMPWG
jgi:hypothetical protein